MNETYRKSVINLINGTNDEEYLKAVYSFAATHPHEDEEKEAVNG